MDNQAIRFIRAAIRGILLAAHLFSGMLLAIPYPYLSCKRQQWILKAWSRKLLDILHVGVLVEGPQPVCGGIASLLISNHVSWLDVFVLNTIHPSRFVTEAAVLDWPLIGWLCRRSGTVFVDRTAHKGTALSNRHIAELLENGACLAIFPEGASTDGRRVGHFHSSLLQPAIEAGVPLRPVALNYRNMEGQWSATANSTGDMPLLHSVWCILSGARFEAVLKFTPTVPTHGANRRELARAAQVSIARALGVAAENRAPDSGGNAPTTEHPAMAA